MGWYWGVEKIKKLDNFSPFLHGHSLHIKTGLFKPETVVYTEYFRSQFLEWIFAIPKEPVAFKESWVEKKQLAIYGATYWCGGMENVIYLKGRRFGWQIGLNFTAEGGEVSRERGGQQRDWGLDISTLVTKDKEE